MSPILPPDASAPPPDRLELTSATDAIAVVAFIGEHDLGQYQPLRETLARAAIRAHNVVVDLSQCVFIDSTVVSLLLHEQSVIATDGGGFAVVIPPDPGFVSRLAALMQLSQILPIHDTVEAAIASLDAAASPRSDALDVRSLE